MTGDAYLNNILIREAVDMGPTSPVWGVQAQLMPLIQEWAGEQLNTVHPSGSFAKGTANRSGTDIDLFISLKHTTTDTLKEIYTKLGGRLREKGYTPRQQNVSWNIRVGTLDVDLVPAKHQAPGDDNDHSLFRRRADTWTKTNVVTHIATVKRGGRIAESRILKLWRDQQGFDFPSFYIELVTIEALGYGNPALAGQGSLADNVWTTFKYLRDDFVAARIVDPANTGNVISEDLTANEKGTVQAAADRALKASNWDQIVR